MKYIVYEKRYFAGDESNFKIHFVVEKKKEAKKICSKDLSLKYAKVGEWVH